MSDAAFEPDSEIRAKPVATRTRIAQRTARALCGDTDAGERRAALLVADILARDVDCLVRQAFAEGVAASAFLPKELAQAIARDVAEVSAPFLRSTPALDEDELEALLADLDPAAVPAVAQRSSVGAGLALALVRGGAREVLHALADNNGADLSESWPELMAAVPDDGALAECIAQRNCLPGDVVVALFEHAGAALRDALVARHGAPDFVGPIAEAACRVGFARALAQCEADTGIAIAAEADRVGRLSPLLLLEVIRSGNRPVVEETMRRRTGRPIADVRRLLRFGERPEVVAGLEAAGVPRSLSGRAWDALAAWRSHPAPGADDPPNGVTAA